MPRRSRSPKPSPPPESLKGDDRRADREGSTPNEQDPHSCPRRTGGDERTCSDYLATEEPLEIRLVAGGQTHKLAITMRTPGADFELPAGCLYGEGVIGGRDDISHITYCTDPDIDSEQHDLTGPPDWAAAFPSTG